MASREIDLRNLPCDLSEEELQIKADHLAQSITDLVQVEEHKKTSMAEYKEIINELKARIVKLGTEIKARAEERLVEVEERKDPLTNTIDMIRLDTGEILESRKIDGQELGAERKLTVVPFPTDKPKTTGDN